MSGEFQSIVAEYGRAVTCYDENGRLTGEGLALVQPVTEKKWQNTAWALGGRDTGRFLCLAPAELPLGEPGDGGWIECGGALYQPIAVHPIPLGETVSHLWAVLERREEDAL